MVLLECLDVTYSASGPWIMVKETVLSRLQTLPDQPEVAPRLALDGE